MTKLHRFFAIILLGIAIVYIAYGASITAYLFFKIYNLLEQSRMANILNTFLYFFTSLAMLALFMVVYEKVTPYREWVEIKNGNTAAAIAFGGALIGFVLPLWSVIMSTHSVLEVIKWGFLVGAIQIVSFLVIHRLRGFGDCVREGRVSSATFLAFASIAIGIINAASISY
ncbi:hypothetical protein [Achromobacter phage Motura]|uniref:DUF350 domain-containing protein n=1 Tax=Achromobacter phage Motura TaxID=2591403 RepID=A0A514CTB2_9CAUD|nr:hypothetical protein H1O15_gp271 [Achromobacter phage Motura]QDH83690.1 hypothetical protein [Achromobacter phage Motura]